MHEKTVLLTGAAKHIGAACAEHLHEAGMNIVVHYNTSAKEAEALADRLNDIRRESAMTVQADLENQTHYQALIDTALAFKDRLDVLINNASTFFPTPIGSLTEEQWIAVMNTNLKAPLFLSQLAAPSLSKAGGCIINIADIHAYRSLFGHSIYSISKAGLITLTQALAKELPKVRVNAISPGAITWPDNMDEEAKAAILAETVMKKPGNVTDIAKAVRFLIEDADYITGQVINVDGGRTLY